VIVVVSVHANIGRAGDRLREAVCADKTAMRAFFPLAFRGAVGRTRASFPIEVSEDAPR
jgi:hypothetical protein